MSHLKKVKLSLTLVDGLLTAMLFFSQSDPVALKTAKKVVSVIGWGITLVEQVKPKPTQPKAKRKKIGSR
jgi:hypothetical protein